MSEVTLSTTLSRDEKINLKLEELGNYFLGNSLNMLKLSKKMIDDSIKNGYNSNNIFRPFLIVFIISEFEGMMKNSQNVNPPLEDNETFAHRVITKFIKNTYSFWDSIIQKNENFLFENLDKLYPELKENYEDKFNQIVELLVSKKEDGTSYVPQALKNTIWEHLEAMIGICVKYIHCYRRPDLVNGKLKYRVKYMGKVSSEENGEIVFEGISVEKSAKAFNIKIPNF